MREQLLWAQRPSDRKSVCPWKCCSGPDCRLVRQTALSSLGPAQGVTYTNCDALPTTSHGPAPGESHKVRGHCPLAYCRQSRSLSQAPVSLSMRKLRVPGWVVQFLGSSSSSLSQVQPQVPVNLPRTTKLSWMAMTSPRFFYYY